MPLSLVTWRSGWVGGWVDEWMGHKEEKSWWVGGWMGWVVYLGGGEGLGERPGLGFLGLVLDLEGREGGWVGG